MKRSTVYGIGINDSPIGYQPDLYFICWRDIMKRCSNNNKLRYHTYDNATVCDEWKSFWVFRQWIIDNNYTKGMNVDKDYYSPGNKHYSPETCIVVTKKINLFLTKSDRIRGEYPIGVTYTKTNKTNPYVSYYRIHGKKCYLGCFPQVELASNAYYTKKQEIALIYKDEVNDPKVKDALQRVHDNIREYFK
jgi:hypothetical protein